MVAGGAGKRKNKIDGPFVAHTRTLVESPAWRELSLAARRALDRIEIEHMAHGGNENGRLIVTYKDFEKWGVRPNSIAGAIRELEALGFIEATQRGYRGAEGMRSPNLYRLTYVQSCDADPRNKRAVSGTHEYLRIKTPDEAEAIASAARKDVDERNVDRAKSNVTTSSFSEHRVH